MGDDDPGALGEDLHDGLDLSRLSTTRTPAFPRARSGASSSSKTAAGSSFVEMLASHRHNNTEIRPVLRFISLALGSSTRTTTLRATRPVEYAVRLVKDMGGSATRSTTCARRW